MDWRRIYRFKFELVQMALLAGIVFLGAVYSAVVDFDRLLTVQNNRLLLAFVLYVASIFAFSVAYYLLYLNDRNNFFFSAGIAGLQGERLTYRAKAIVPAFVEIAQVLSQAEPRLEAAAKQKIRLDDVGSIPGAPDMHISREGRRYSLRLTAQYAIHFEARDINSPRPVAPVEYAFLTKGDVLLGEEFCLMHFYVSNTKDLYDAILEIKLRCQEGAANLQAKVGTLSSTAPDIWAYRDFFYFSTITQTTVGYGDILPNSSVVRTFVVVQILIGYLIIAIFINMTFAR